MLRLEGARGSKIMLSLCVSWRALGGGAGAVGRSGFIRTMTEKEGTTWRTLTLKAN